MIDHNEVLNRWRDNERAAAIARDLGLRGPHTVRVIVQRARAKGDPRAAARRRAPGNASDDKITIVLQGFSMVPGLREEAERRKISVATLVNGLMEAIVIDQMFNAILDE